MKSLPIARRTRIGAFTFAELVVSTAIASVVGLMGYTALVGTMKLSSQNMVTNISNFRARQMLDRIGEIARYAIDTPVLIKADGTAATGTTSDGILVKNALSGVYVFRNSSGVTDADIPQGTTSFNVEYAATTGAELPKVGDFFLIGLSTRPDLEVTAVTALTPSGSLQRARVTTAQGLPELAKPGSYTVTGQRYRKEAFIFAPSGTRWNLRHYARVTSATSFTNPQSYGELGMGFLKLGSQSWFTTMIDNGTQATWMRAIARSSNRAEYTDSSGRRNTLTSMPIQIKLWNYNPPPPAP